jgi:hypothetical protein
MVKETQKGRKPRRATPVEKRQIMGETGEILDRVAKGTAKTKEKAMTDPRQRKVKRVRSARKN